MFGRATITLGIGPHSSSSLLTDSPPPVDIIRAMMVVWRIRGKIIKTYNRCARYVHMYELFLKLSVGLGLGLVSCVHLGLALCVFLV